MKVRDEFFFCPLLEKFCPLFKHFAHMGSRLPRLRLILPTFKFRTGNQVFWGGLWGVLCMHMSMKGVSDS